MSTDQVQQILDAVKAASPALWAAARHQVQAQIAQDVYGALVFSLFAVAASIGVLWMARRAAAPKRNAFDDNIGWFTGASLSFLVVVGFLIADICVINDLIQKLMAPDYATIQALTSLLPGH